MDFPAPGALARFGALGFMLFNVPTQGPSKADSLRSLVVAVITDELAPISIRNHCHRLMVAIERNNQTLVDESLMDLERAAEDTRYQLPRLTQSNPSLDRAPSAPEPVGQV